MRRLIFDLCFTAALLLGIVVAAQAQFNSFPPGVFTGRAALDASGGGGPVCPTFKFANTGANATNSATFTASIATTVLTVTVASTGTIAVGQTVYGTSVTTGTVITSLGTGAGGVGTYNINNSQTVVSEAMTTGALIWSVGGNSLSAGDLVVLVDIEGDPSMSFVGPGTLTPVAFNTLLDNYDGAHNGAYANLSWKKAAGGETTFTSAPAGRTIQGEWAMVVYTGANASPIDGNSLALSLSANATMTAASISPVSATDILLAYASVTNGGGTGTAGGFGGMTSRVDTGGSGSFTNQTQIFVNEQCLSASGATGAKTATQNASSFYFSGLMGIKP